MQNVLPSTALSPEEETEEEATMQEKEKMINISYELAAEASKRSKLVAGMPLERRGRRLFLKFFYCGSSNCSCVHCVSVQSFIIVASVGSSLISSTSVIIFPCCFWLFGH